MNNTIYTDETARLKRLAERFEQKAAEESVSSAPWAMSNLRTYQNLASSYWGEYYAACRADGIEP